MPSEPSFVQSGFTLLNEMDDADLDWMFSAGTWTQIPESGVLVEEGARLQTLYLVMEGLLGVYSAALGGRQLATLGAGQIIGEMSFLEGRPASATVKALEDSQVLAIDRTRLDLKLQEDAPLAARLYKSLAVITSRRLREMVGSFSRWMEVENPLPADATMLRRWQEVAGRTQQFKQVLVQFEKATTENAATAARKLDEDFVAFCEFLNGAIGDDSGERVDAREELGARVQREILPYFLKSTAAEQLYKKSRGYAGDFLSVQRLYENLPRGTGNHGAGLDECILGSPTVEAIRARKDAMAAGIVRAASASSGPFLVASLGSGPATELFAAFEQVATPQRLHATVVDFDPQALASVVSRRDDLRLTAQITPLNTNFFYLATGRQNVELPPQDLVYTITLADSCNDKLLLRLLDSMYRLLKPGGCAFIASLSPGDSSKAFFDYVVEWKLVRRTGPELVGLLRKANFVQPSTKPAAGPKGVALLAHGMKPRR